VPIAIKAAFLNCGQNCASAERFIVQRKIYDKFCARVTEVAKSMRQGATLGAGEATCKVWGFIKQSTSEMPACVRVRVCLCLLVHVLVGVQA
jgi:hypothetical protein